MKNLSVGELKARFSEIIEEVKSGETIGVLYGKKKQPVAMIVPFSSKKRGKRKIGVLQGKVTIAISEDIKMTEEELIVLK